MLEEFTYEFGDGLLDLGLALLILLGGWLLAWVAARVAGRLVRAAGDERLSRAMGLPAADPERAPSRLVAGVVRAAVLLFALVQALAAVGFQLGAELVTRFLTFGADVLLGLAVLGLGLWLARLAADTVAGVAGPRLRGLAPATRVAVTVLAVFMALEQMGIAGEIVRLLFTFTVGAAALAAALAFGLGCREQAGRLVERWLAGRGDDEAPR